MYLYVDSVEGKGMKRIISIIIALLFFMVPLMSNAETHRFVEGGEGGYCLFLTVDEKWHPMDDNMIVTTYLDGTSDPIEEEVGVPGETLKEMVVENNLFLFGTYGDVYLSVYINEAEEFEINQLNNYTDKEVLEIFNAEDIDGVTNQEVYRVEDNDGQKYVRILSYDEEYDEYILDYMTIVNANIYTFKFEKFNKDFSASEEYITKQVLNGATYKVNPELAKEPNGLFSEGSILYKGLIAGALGAILAIIGFFTSKSKRKENEGEEKKLNKEKKEVEPLPPRKEIVNEGLESNEDNLDALEKTVCYCWKCGEKVSIQDAYFCTKCGAELTMEGKSNDM